MELEKWVIKYKKILRKFSIIHKFIDKIAQIITTLIIKFYFATNVSLRFELIT